MKWIRLLTAAFALLATAAAYAAGAAGDWSGADGFERTTMTLVPVVLILVPLAALVLGITGQSVESGGEPFLFAQSIDRATVLLGRWLGESTALTVAIAIGFGAGAVVVAFASETEGLLGFVFFVVAAVVLGTIFLSLAAAIASSTETRVTALGVGTFTWFFFVLLYDAAALSLAGWIAGSTGGRVLFGSVFFNPADLIRIAMLAIAGTPNVLGAAGTRGYGSLAGRCRPARCRPGRWPRGSQRRWRLAFIASARATCEIAERRAPLPNFRHQSEDAARYLEKPLVSPLHSYPTGTARSASRRRLRLAGPETESAMRRALFFASVFLCFAGAVHPAYAMPNFARKLGVGCATCHTTIPKLNETGYRFRAAGWRMPSDIGKPEDKPFNLGDYTSARIQARYDGSTTSIGPVSSHNSQFTFHELTFYPMTGSWDKYYSSLVEISFAPEEPAEVENGYLRVNVGNDDRFFSARFGIFHPFEGYGASDRPVSINRPYLQRTAANFNQSTFFTPWNFDEAGAEVGMDYKRTSLRATVFNGLVVREEEGTFLAFPAQGGPLAKGTSLPSAATPDFQLFATERLTADGGGVSWYYYHGNLDLPIGTTGDVFQNSYDRVAVYGSYPVIPKVQLLGAYQWGRDHLASGGTFSSRGAFGEVNVPFHQYATAGVRYDWFDPAHDRADNEIRAVVGFVNVPLQNGFQLIGEYQNRRTLRGINPDRKDNIFQVRLIFIL